MIWLYDMSLFRTVNAMLALDTTELYTKRIVVTLDTYRISKLVQMPMLSGIIDVRLFPLTSLHRVNNFNFLFIN